MNTFRDRGFLDRFQIRMEVLRDMKHIDTISFRTLRTLLATGFILVTCLCPVFGFVSDSENDIAKTLLIAPDSSILVKPSLIPYFTSEGNRCREAGMEMFFDRHGTDWDVQWDARSDRPNIISGQGIPFFPGPGNDLTLEKLSLRGEKVSVFDQTIATEMALEFIERQRDLLRVDLADLEINDLSTRSFGNNNRLWFIHFDQFHEGVRIKYSDVYLRVNAGNITQFGTHAYQKVDETLPAVPRVKEDQALNISIAHAETVLTGDLEIVAPPELLFLPVFPEMDRMEPGERFTGEAGSGYAHRLVWELKFRINPSPETWFAVIDAQTGKILSFRDDNKYESVTGGVYPVTNIDPEVELPFPFTTTSQGITTSAGRFDYTGGSVSCNLNGQYVRINDNCGAISMSANGDLNFGSSGGIDCTTPGFGGSGNTHASRSCFYHVSQLKFKAMGYLPSNSWLQGNILSNVNINNTCNAYWNGSSINFYRSGGGCSNTGEIASVFLHEWGHGLDYNTGTSSSDSASSEALADSMSFLQTHVSCIGHNFRPGTPCSFGCDSTCTGVRDPAVRPYVRPSTIDESPADCDRWDCPYYGYDGIMGYEGHCEAIIAAGAVWDAAQKLAAVEDGAAGWALANRIFFETMGDARDAYEIQSGGTCNPDAAIDGCESENWYTVWLFADDDNGNLTDGTPHGGELWEAFNDHGIACGTQPANYTACAPLTAPVLSVMPGDNTATLSWTEVTNANSYIIYRNTLGCDSEMNIIGTSSSTQFEDDSVANDYFYYYAVQAVGMNDACRSHFSDCLEIEITGCANPPLASAGSDMDTCPGTPVTLGGSPTASQGTPPYTYLWTPGNYTEANPQIYPNATTTFALTVTDSIGCMAADSVTVTIDAPPTDAGEDKFVCNGYCVEIGAASIPGYTYSWTPTTGLNNPNISNPTACVTSNTVYTLTTNATGYLCSGQDTVTVHVSNPTLETGNYDVISDSGDGDGSIEAGERCVIRVEITNNSLVEAYDASVQVFSADPYIYIYSAPASLGTISAMETVTTDIELVVDMLHECPTTTEISVDVITCGGNYHPLPLTLTLGQPGGLETIYSTGFEGADDEGWTHVQVATQDDWQRDAPFGTSGNDPSSAYEGTKIWGNDLGPDGWDGDYKNSVENYLLSPAIDCSGKSGVRLQFMRWLTVEEAMYDQATISINNNQVWQNQQSGNHIDNSWTPVDLDISQYADNNAAVRVRYELVSDSGLVFGGWNIDQFAIIADAPAECDIFSCDSADADAGADFTVVSGAEAVLNGVSSTINGCVADLEYRWRGGDLGGGIWSDNPVAVSYPTEPTTFSLDIRCSGSPDTSGCADSDTVTVYISGSPTPTAPPPTHTMPPATVTPSPTPTRPPPTPTTPPGEPTFTPQPTFTPTPGMDSLTVDLILTQDLFHIGDRFALGTVVVREGANLYVDEYLVLDVYGSYWFYPTWSQNLDSNNRMIETGEQYAVIFDFTWPEVNGSAYDIQFLYLLTRPQTYTILSNIDSVTFGYE